MKINFVTSILITSTIYTCQRCFNKFIFKNKLFKHFRFEYWKINSNYIIITNNVNNFNQVNKIENFNQVNNINNINQIDNSILIKSKILIISFKSIQNVNLSNLQTF